jgi:ABC-2 type transport system permease protein
MGNIIRRQLERHWVFLLVVMLVLALFEFLLCAIVASVDVEAAFGQMLAFAPPMLRAVIEQNMPGGSPAGILSFGWNHPVAHALLTAVAITLGARAIAGEVENGVIELVLAQPISRAQYFTAHLLFGAAAIGAAIAGGVAGTALGQVVFSLDAFGPARLAILFVNVFLLQFAIYAFTLAASALGREAGRVALVGVLFAVMSFFVNAVATLWNKALFAKPYSLHTYFEPRDLLTQGHLATSSVVVLGTFALVAVAIAFTCFARRDLP